MLKVLLYSFFMSAIMLAQSFKIPKIEFSPKNYICYHTNEPIIIDGKLDELSWTKAEGISDFIEIKGISQTPPRLKTVTKMLWDDKYLYVAAEIEDSQIWGTLKNRDDRIYNDNAFELFIDPSGSTHTYCELEINALNTIWDLLMLKPYRDMKKPNISGWDIKGFKSAISINGKLNKPYDKNKGWSVELAIPWATFDDLTEVSVPPKDFDQWRMNFLRVEWRAEVKDGKYQKEINPATNKPYSPDYWVWAPQGVVDMHYPEMWGFVQFSKESVGALKVPFVVKEEDAAKWLLRKIFYQERDYYIKNGKFTKDLNELSIKLQPMKGYSKSPIIECTSDMFEVSIQADDGSKIIKIKEDGLIWTVPLKK